MGLLPRPLIRDHGTAVLVAVIVFVLGAYLLWDAYEGRGKPAPKIMRPFSFW